MVLRGTLDPCTCLIRPLDFLCISLYIWLSFVWLYLYVVADCVDFICIFVSGSGSDCEFISQKISIIKCQGPCWAIRAFKHWERIVLPKWKRKALPKISWDPAIKFQRPEFSQILWYTHRKLKNIRESGSEIILPFNLERIPPGRKQTKLDPRSLGTPQGTLQIWYLFRQCIVLPEMEAHSGTKTKEHSWKLNMCFATCLSKSQKYSNLSPTKIYNFWQGPKLKIKYV